MKVKIVKVITEKNKDINISKSQLLKLKIILISPFIKVIIIDIKNPITPHQIK